MLPDALSQSTPSSPDSPCELHVLLHYRDSLCMYGAQVRVLEKMDQERLATFL